MEDSVLFLGKFDNKLLEFEEKIIKNLEELLKGRSDFHLNYDKSNFPDVIKYQVGNCKMWPILGDVKPTLLLKDLISKTKVVLFIFNLTNLETLEFLREGWGPIIKKVNPNKSNEQTCILIGTQSEPNNYTDNLSDKISSTMELLNCCAYFKEEINNKPTRKKETIGRYPIFPNFITLIHFIKDQIPTEFTKPHKDIDKLNENKETEKEGESFNTNDEDKKVIVKFNDIMICNLFTKNQTAEIVKIQNIGSFRIPASVNYRKKDYKITSICDHALENSIITNLSFEKNSEIKRIGDYAFQKSKIQQLFIPSSLEQLGKYWRADANELLKIEVDESNKHFSMLKEFLIFKNGSTSEILFAPPNTEEKFSIQKDFCIGNYAFSNNKGLQRLVSRGSFQHLDIGDYSFYGAQDLQDVTLDSKELNIGDCCFQGSQKLQSIKITSNKLNIGNGSFVNCTSLKTAIFDKIETAKISPNAFLGCESLEEFKITSSSLEIGEQCFFNAINLKEIEIIGKESLVIGENCFENCTSLSSVSLINKSDENMTLPKNIFSGCKSLKSIIIESNSTVNLDNESFADNNKLETVSIIGNEIIIGNKCFYGCFNKEKYEYKQTNNYRYQKERYTIKKSLSIKSKSNIELGNNCFENSYIENIKIEGEKLNIKKECFKNCKSLKEFQISNISSISIDKYSFNMCQNLKTISFEKVDDITIRPNAFSRCDLLETIEIKSTSKIHFEKCAFNGCENLQKVILNSNRLIIDNQCFSGAINLQTIELISQGILDIGDYCFKNCTSLSDILLQNNGSQNMMISNNAFNGCNSLINITIKSNSTTKLSKGLFSYNNKLETVIITGDEIIIEDQCFTKCFNNDYNKNTLIMLSKNNIELGNNSFENSYIRIIEIKGKELIIKKESFNNCVFLKMIQISNTINIILEEYSFNKCSYFSKILLKNIGNINIQSNAFNECKYLKQIIFNDSSKNDNDTFIIDNIHKIRSVTIKNKEIVICSYCFREYNDALSKPYLTKASRKPIYKSKLTFVECLDNFTIDINQNYDNEVTENKNIQERNDYNEQKETIENVVYNLLRKNNSAEILNVKYKKGDYVIPAFVKYEGKNYEITRICDYAFQNSSITNLSFHKNSRVQKIGNFAFQKSRIQKLSLPSSLQELCEYWCAEANELSEVKIISSNLFSNNYNGFLFHTTNSTYEILFAPRGYKWKYSIPEYTSCNNILNIEEIRRTISKLPYQILNLGNYSFFGMKNLPSVTLVSKNINIGNYCFSGSKNLQSVIFIGQESLNIGEHCFLNCSSLTSILLQNESKQNMILSKIIFDECKSLTTVTLKSQSTIILHNELFSGKNKLEKVSIIGNEIIIGDQCFYGCFTKEQSRNQSISISRYSSKTTTSPVNKIINICSNSKIEIGNKCFENSFIDIIKIEGEELIIKKECFKNCSYLREFHLSNISNITIDEYSFSACTNLSTISFPDIKSITINKNAFSGCSKLETFLINSTIRRNYYPSEKYIEFSTTNSEKIHIGEYCFNNCNNLKIISFGHASNVNLLPFIFSGCKSLREFKIESSNLDICNNCFSNTQELSLIDLIIKERFNIDKHCFNNCKSLSSFLLQNEGDQILALSKNTFNECKSLINVIIKSKSAVNLDDELFSKNKKLEKVSINCSEAIIGEKCFYECFNKNKNQIRIKSKNKIELKNNSFENSFLNKIDLECKELIIQQECFKNCLKLNTFQISNIPQIHIEKCAFNGCENLQKIILNSNRLIIDNECFSGAINLQTIELIGNESLIIEEGCFDNCNSLLSITLQDKSDQDMKISKRTFNECKSLINVNITSNSALKLNNDIFSENNKLEAINISCNTIVIDKCFENSSLKKIEMNCKDSIIIKESFKNCLNLKEIILSNAPQIIIEENSFCGCLNLSTISLSKIGYIKSNAFYECNANIKVNINFSQNFDSFKFFDTEKKLQDGNSSKLFVVKDKMTNEKYVVKQQGIYYNKQQNNINRIILSLRKSNPTISPFFAFGMFKCESQQSFAILTKYFEKGSLEGALENNILSGTQKYIILLGIALGMKHIHTNNIEHQNLSPRKVLLDDNYYPILNNIGAFKQKDNNSNQDTFSFASIVYQMITGKKSHLSNFIYDTEFKKIQDLSIQKFLEKCLSYEHGLSFTEIFNEITQSQYMKIFEANKKEIDKYLILFGIEIPILVEIDDISYSLFKHSETAIINQANKINRNFKIEEKISRKFKYYKIVQIKDYAFSKNTLDTSLITYIYFPSTLEKIGNCCFAGFQNLKTISFKSPNLVIGQECFKECKYLTTILFNRAQNVSIGSKCFKDCISIHEIYFRCQKITINSNCFENCKYLESFKCETSDLTICQQIFNGCDKLENISITQGQSNGIENEMQNNELVLSKNLFSNLNSLKTFNIEINQSIIIKSNPFNQCQSLSKVRFKSMHSVVFKAKSFYQVNIKSFEVTGNKVEFGENCFSYSNGLQSMKITCDELSIAINCFNSCSELSSISFENLKCAKIDIYSFYNCNKLTVLELSTSKNLDINRSSFYNLKGLREISLKTRNLIIGNKTYNKSNEKDANKISLNGLDAHCNLHFI